MEMEGEIKNFIMVWSVASATMCYCHRIGKLIPEGTSRLIALFPAIGILLLLPLRLISVHLGGPSAFFLGWLSTFKLILFAFGKGPLSSNPPLSLPHFVPIACLPIKFEHDPKHQIPQKKHKSPFSYASTSMVIILAALIPLYGKKEYFHPKFVFFLYGLHMYIGLEFIFATVSAATRKLIGVQLEPQFKEPYLCTSLQDFWGRRWNIMVNRVLHPTVYDPVKNLSARVLGRKWAPLPAILASFAVSGMMHELVFYYIKREKRTWEVWEPSWDATCFFLIHGVCVAMEVGIKKSLRGKKQWQVPRVLSWMLTLLFVLYTAMAFFLPALARCRVYEKATRELTALTQFLMDVYGLYSLQGSHK
ncbi:acyl-CoA--sterol O-acyltransferase 1-like [Glycine soja]|uniref:Acyl-CoA--sterol O-acyltransferase 1 n=1 Tax=Glycine soja TaxID=3848 RepID=A0A445IVH5_GLYSO|nr:acyl-CoA--sterol O-acyltransferase 1-like [Glycine soja]KHN40830.1 Acyl-CoA--sterol O-acyltransferase 1 [Glycine soja]RZB90050.1 Acyl-CoA--sterol O-acyltransferase 1 [Glycine soja]